MAETKFIDKKKLKHFEKQLAARDKYVKENGDYIETKRDKIGLSSPEILAELCFALYMEDENIEFELNFRLFQLLEDTSYLETAYNQVQEKANNLEPDIAAKFLNYPIPKAIVEEWEKV